MITPRTRLPFRNARAVFLTTIALLWAAGCEHADLQGPASEVKEHNIKLDLPAVPEFDIPEPNADGTHSVREMRLRGDRYLGTEVKIKGYVLWIYDCPTALRTPEMTDKELQRILRDEPERCNIPHFYLGDEANSPADKSVWIAEVPRAPRKDELKAGDEELVAQMKAAFEAMPKFSVGDQLTVSGTWETSSPRGFKREEGLLVYGGLQNLSQAAATPVE